MSDLKNILTIGALLVLTGCQTTGGGGGGEKLSFMINDGQCGQATEYARRNFSDSYLNFALGRIQLECLANRDIAIDYFKLAANAGYTPAAEQLVRLGVSPTMPAKPTVIYQPAPPTPPVRIIIQQPQNDNPNACIQDGGGVFCPNYRKR